MAIEDQIADIEAEIGKTKYNKATSHHIGKLKAKLAALREEQVKRASAGGSVGRSFAVAKSGHATVAFVGFPSVGKSTLLNKLTGTESEVAAYEFTTLTIIPGLLEYRGAKIQLLDMPGIIRGAARGKGRGKEVLSVARGADLILVIVDAFNPGQLEALEGEINTAGIRMNTRPPHLQMVRGDKGGVTFHPTTKQSHLTEDLVRDICHEFGIVNAHIIAREDATPERLIDFLAGNRVYNRGVIVISKTDLVDPESVREQTRVYQKLGWQVVPISAETGQGMTELKESIYNTLGFIRVYLKPPGKEADFKEPLIVKQGSTVKDVCEYLHRQMAEKFRFALVTGKSAKFKEQTVGLEHVLADEDVLTIVQKRG
ncbi:MAG: GTP-binding protein [Halobacteriales archaeon]|nr:GTP-binding protein [Halobacteriales archaeon]